MLSIAGLLKQKQKSKKSIGRGAPSSPYKAQKQSMIQIHVCLQNLSKSIDFAPRHPKSHFTCVKIIEKPLDMCKIRSALVRSAARQKVVPEQFRKRARAVSKMLTKPVQKQEFPSHGRQLGHETILTTTFSRQATRQNTKNIKKALDV